LSGALYQDWKFVDAWGIDLTLITKSFSTSSVVPGNPVYLRRQSLRTKEKGTKWK
jgi:hypothetical protein